MAAPPRIHDEPSATGHRRSLLILAWLLLAAMIGLPFAIVGLALTSGDSDNGEPGDLDEQVHEWSGTDGPLPVLEDVTGSWGLADFEPTGTTPLSGGGAAADLDRDGALDLVVADGGIGLYFNNGDGFETGRGRVTSEVMTATSVAVGDLDGDSWVDVLVGQAEGVDVIIWGGSWTVDRDLSGAVTSTLPGGEATTGLLVAELTGDGRQDILRLGYGSNESAAPDVIWTQTAPRQFEAHPLPGSERRSLAAQIVDVDEDGLVDIWITRDVGWLDGGDSLYSRGDGSAGEWQDRAAEFGVDMEIDGMGLTVADVDADGALDAYVSDLGDNEIMARRGDGFRALDDTGAKRIRAPGAPRDVVSSSWGSAAGDINLDGRLDLVVVNGGFVGQDVPNKIPGADIAVEDPPAILLGRGDGQFADVWPELGLAWSGRSRGLVTGDFDADGDTDLVVLNRGEGVVAYRNDTTGPSVVVRSARPCSSAGVAVAVTSSNGSVTALLAPATFLGAHAAEIVIGTPPGEIEIEIRRPGELPERRQFLSSAGRRVVTVDCRDPIGSPWNESTGGSAAAQPGS